ncbi:MAG: NERD domain-containing protein [Proteobacteria bacterium]|nr:NERD domain-containing protein [Pseudomonadota bacterium]
MLPTATPPDPLAPLVTAAIHGALGTLLPLGIALALLAAAAAWLKPYLKGAAGEAAVARRLRRLGFPCLHDVILPAKDGSLTQIDHIALTAQGPLAIETKTYAGRIFGQQNDRAWTQALGGRKSRFQNPLRQNYKHVAALRHHLRTEVQGLVVFAGTARFPNGLPQGVVTLATFAAHMDRLGRPAPPQLAAPAWQTACRLAEQGRGQHQAHLAGLRARRSA